MSARAFIDMLAHQEECLACWRVFWQVGTAAQVVHVGMSACTFGMSARVFCVSAYVIGMAAENLGLTCRHLDMSARGVPILAHQTEVAFTTR